MSELRVSEWKRYGKDRLYVSQPDGTTVAWFDCATGQIHIKVEARRELAIEALAPYITRRSAPLHPFTGPAGEQASPPLPPEFDLALNRPGESLQAMLEEATPGRLARSLAWVLGRRTTAYSWKAGIAGERAVGRELDRLSRHGWRVLHSIPLSSKNDIDHLLIGPGGVFTINTKNHPGMAVWVGDDSVRINHGESRPYVRKSRAEAARAVRALERGCAFPVEVKPLLVFVKPARIDVVASLRDVRALSERELSAFAPLVGVLTAQQVETVYDVARDRRTWSRR
jgi:hypothetical protein